MVEMVDKKHFWRGGRYSLCIESVKLHECIIQLPKEQIYTMFAISSQDMFDLNGFH